VTGILRAPRRAALVAIAVLVAAASLVSFAESYRGLYVWAHEHGLSGPWAVAWPLQVDVFIAVGELALFVALADRWAPRSRAAAWAVTLAGLAVSVAGNVGHIEAHSLAARATAAVPPLAAASALAVGLGVLKRVVEHHHHQAQRPAATDRPSRRSRPAARRGQGRRSQADIEAQALAALSGQPDMTGPQLAAAIGVSDRTARRIRARLTASHGTPSPVPAMLQPAQTPPGAAGDASREP
jgi:Protein of unknown function (DUF2637)